MTQNAIFVPIVGFPREGHIILVSSYLFIHVSWNTQLVCEKKFTRNLFSYNIICFDFFCKHCYTVHCYLFDCVSCFILASLHPLWISFFSTYLFSNSHVSLHAAYLAYVSSFLRCHLMNSSNFVYTWQRTERS